MLSGSSPSRQLRYSILQLSTDSQTEPGLTNTVIKFMEPAEPGPRAAEAAFPLVPGSRQLRADPLADRQQKQGFLEMKDSSDWGSYFSGVTRSAGEWHPFGDQVFKGNGQDLAMECQCTVFVGWFLVPRLLEEAGLTNSLL